MNKLTVLIGLAALTLLTACSGADSLSERNSQPTGIDMQSLDAAMAEPAFADDSLSSLAITSPAGMGEAAPEPAPATGALEQVGRKVIATASLSLEVEAVQQTIASIRAVVAELGGFIEHLSSSGGAKEQYASVVVRVPEAQFFPAMDRITTLGKLLSQSVGSQDVTEQAIDLEARLKSALRQEESLLKLLDRSGNVTEVLAIERELVRVRSEVERLQGQQAFLDRRVALATITVELRDRFVAIRPPSADLTVEVGRVGERVDEVKRLVANLDGTVDRVFLSSYDGEEQADMTVQVFTADFARTLAEMESGGSVLSKQVDEGTQGDGASDGEPNAQIRVTYIQAEGSNVWLYLIIGVAAVVGALVVALVGALTVRRIRQ